MITLITPTGDRPEAFALCKKWMDSQHKQFDQWIIVDDGEEPISEELLMDDRIDYIRRLKRPSDPPHTINLNLWMAIPYVKGNKIFIIEDDDFYSPKYLHYVSECLEHHAIVGEMGARYYNLPVMKYRRIGNTTHASLCQTAFRRSMLSAFEKCIPGDPYVDARFWNATKGKQYLINDMNDQLRLHCALKGLKGRKGIGTGHDPNAKYYLPDWNLSVLTKWVGIDNMKLYMDMVGQSVESGVKMSPSHAMRKKYPRPRPHTVVSSEDTSGVTVITCTGDRPEAFILLNKWMNRQTKQPNQWIVVDDGESPIMGIGQFEYVRRISETKFKHTLCLNMAEALERIKYSKVLFMEDDDWYSPSYIEYMSKLLDKADLVGINRAVFYHPQNRTYIVKNPVKQPALFQTGMKNTIIPIIRRICTDTANKERQLKDMGLIDVFLWRETLNEVYEEIPRIEVDQTFRIGNGRMIQAGTKFIHPDIPQGILHRAQEQKGCRLFFDMVKRKGIKMAVALEKDIAVGMKGMPGRKGLTTAQNSANSRYQQDPTGSFLKNIIGDDFSHYEGFYQRR